MVPLLVIAPLVPGAIRMPVTLLASLMVMVPAFETLLLLSTVTAVPLVRVIDPAELMVISSRAPLAMVEVLTAAVVAVLMVVSAIACAAVRATRTGAMAVQASRCRI